jgi:hypothetical protein
MGAQHRAVRHWVVPQLAERLLQEGLVRRVAYRQPAEPGRQRAEAPQHMLERSHREQLKRATSRSIRRNSIKLLTASG